MTGSAARRSPSSAAEVRSFVIDTDTASDDAVALLLAVADPSVEIAAVTVVAGNVPLDLAVRNAIVTLDVAGAAHVPVHPGLDRPIQRPLETAQDVHGEDGMGGVALPAPSRSADDESAVDVLARLADDEPGRHTLVTLGPLSNVASALLVEPDLLTRFAHTYMMLGSPDGVGNVNVAGEYNAWADPEAAAIVLAAPGAKTMVGWNISRTFAVITADQDAELRSVGPLGEFVSAINADVLRFCHEVTGLDGYDLPDPIAMAIALDERLILESSEEIFVVGLDEPTRGAVLMDRRHEAPADGPRCRVVWAADADGFRARLTAACTPHRPSN
jgi:purine nucleosidase